VRRRDRDAESLEAGRVWGGSPVDKGVGGKLPQRGPGQSPGRKPVLMHLKPVYIFKEFSPGDIALPFLLSPPPLYSRSRRRKPRGRKGMGRVPSRQGVWGYISSLSGVRGRAPDENRFWCIWSQCIFKEFSLGDIALPFLLSPLLSFFPYLPFPFCLSPSPNPFLRSFPFLVTKQPPKILLGVWGWTVSSPSGVPTGTHFCGITA